MGWIELGLITSKYSGGFRQRQMELFAHLQDAVVPGPCLVGLPSASTILSA